MFKDNKILLVHENNETWLLPCCWCDVLESVKSNTIKKEESGRKKYFLQAYRSGGTE